MVPIPRLPVEGLYVNVLLVLTVVTPEVTSTNEMYLEVSVESEETPTDETLIPVNSLPSP